MFTMPLGVSGFGDEKVPTVPNQEWEQPLHDLVETYNNVTARNALEEDLGDAVRQAGEVEHPGHDADAVEVRGHRLGVHRLGVHALVVGLRHRFVVRRVRGGVDQIGLEPDLGQDLRDQAAGLVGLLVERPATDVDPLAEGLVERTEHLLTVPLLRSDQDPDRTPGRRQHLAILIRDVPVLVEVGQAHHVPVHLDVADLLDLEDPARGDPGEGTQRVEPQVGAVGRGLGRSSRLSHVDATASAGRSFPDQRVTLTHLLPYVGASAAEPR